MKIVVDTSAIIAAITNETTGSAIAEATQGAELFAPSSVHWEIGNAFSAMLKRKRLSLEKVLQAMKIYNKIPIRFVEIEIEEAIKIAHKLNLYAYDAYLIECAIRHKVPLLTLDQKLKQLAQHEKVKTVEIYTHAYLYLF